MQVQVVVVQIDAAGGGQHGKALEIPTSSHALDIEWNNKSTNETALTKFARRVGVVWIAE